MSSVVVWLLCLLLSSVQRSPPIALHETDLEVTRTSQTYRHRLMQAGEILHRWELGAGVQLLNYVADHVSLDQLL